MAMKKKAINSTLVLSAAFEDDSALMKALIALLLLFPVLAAAQVETSSTQQNRVVIQGGESELRGVIVHEAETLINALDALVGEVKGVPFSIIVDLHPPAKGKPSALVRNFLQLEDPIKKYLLEIKMRLGQGNSFDQKKLDRALLEMLLIERTLRGMPAEEIAERVEIRPWLLDGISEALLWKAGKGDRRIYASLVESGGWMEVEKLVETETTAGMFVLSRELFRASSGALVMALLAQEQGKEAMANYLSRVATFEGEHLTLLRSNFPQVNLGREGLERWWMLQVAAMAEAPLTERLTIPETEEALGKALTLYFKSATGRSIEKGLEAWPEISRLETEEERIAVVRPATDLLTHLSYRCFPTYLPIIGGYLQALSDLATGEPKDLDLVFKNLRAYRDAEGKRFEMVVDLLDYYHISTVQEESGEFEDYLRFKRNLDKGSGQSTDPFNLYLDGVQELFEPIKRK